MKRWKIIIVGSGPAGSATAMALAQRDTALARDTLLLEKAVHPRPKLCGGGVTPLADLHLQAFAFQPSVPHFPVHLVHFHCEGHTLELERVGEPLFRVVDRRHFDEALAREAVRRGATLREGEAVKRVAVDQDHVRVTTEKESYEADVLVAADGAKSVVRRHLLPGERGRISRLLEVLTPEEVTHPLFASHCAVFDFSAIGDGVQGYRWDFPSIRDGQSMMNRGIFDSRIDPHAPRADLRQALDDFLPKERPLEAYPLQGHPERWYHPSATISLPRVLFVGEAAGIEPFAGEGIGFALGYGRLAADALADAFTIRDFSFAAYPEQVRLSPLGRTMSRRRRTANVLYRLRYPRLWRVGLRLSIPVVRRLLPPYIAVRYK